MHDHADKSWLAEEAEEYNRESRQRQEGLVAAAGIFAIGGLIGLAAFDWTQGSKWASALVALIYQVGPL